MNLKRYRLPFMLLTSLAVLVLATCTAASGPEQETQSVSDADMLDNTEWWLAELDGERVSNNTEPPINLRLFAAGDVRPEAEYGGFTGCNYFGGKLHLREETIFTETGMTRESCPPGMAEQEAAILSALRSASALRLTSDDRLQVVDADGRVALTYDLKLVPAVDAALAESEWSLIELDGQLPLDGTRINLNIIGGESGSNQAPAVSGSAGCNGFGGEIRVANEGTLRLVDVANTEMDCAEPEGIMAQEAAFLTALRGVLTYELDDDHLHLQDETGQTRLIFLRKNEPVSDPSALIGRGWQLTRFGEEAPQADRPITLVFHDERRFSGQSDCRSYVGTYQADQDNIAFNSFSMLGELKPDCGTERLYLPTGGDYRLTATSLEIIPARDSPYLYEPLPEQADAPLGGTTWRLLARIEAVDPAPRNVIPLLPETEITLQFDDQRLAGVAGCNSYGAAYQVDDMNLVIDVLEATAMGCLEPDGIMAQEQAFLAALGRATSVRLDGPHLWLELDDGQALLFTAAEE